ncbi:protein of unknown function (plasmid) [Azospirillum lipoferum 4B]|uniref:Uncharacterized protein n=1 Tax=Azospirillum lipoferum (strain 4B) TaxID=862719 RepID=G7ZB13_AZOL4|nr:protein of unknown function [Azospirillum lipoferum 4B]
MAAGSATAAPQPAGGSVNVCVLPCRGVAQRVGYCVSRCFCWIKPPLCSPDPGRNAPRTAPDWQNGDVRTIRRRADSRPILRRFRQDDSGGGEGRAPLFGRTATFAARIRQTQSSGPEESFGTTATFGPESFGTTATPATGQPMERCSK